MQKKTNQQNGPDAGTRKEKDQLNGLPDTKENKTGKQQVEQRTEVNDNPGETKRKIPHMQRSDKGSE